MKIKELKSVVFSSRDNIQFAILYDSKTNEDIADSTIEYIVEYYGDKEVKRIEAVENQLLITV